MVKYRKTLTLVLLSIVALATVAGLIALLLPPESVPVIMPTPNGYSAFTNAGHQVQKNTSDFTTMTREQLQMLIEGNSNALQIARTGLSQEARVPAEYSEAYNENHLVDLERLKLLAYAFLADGRLAEMDQCTNDAAKSYLDTIHLGIESRRGGNLIDALVGVAIESMGVERLQKLTSNLDGKTCGELGRKIEALDANKEAWDQILRDENDWTRRTFGLNYRVMQLLSWSSTKAARAKAQRKFNTQQTKTRRLMIDLAARAYEFDNGHRSGNVNDLVPIYLHAVPQDSTTGTNVNFPP